MNRKLGVVGLVVSIVATVFAALDAAMGTRRIGETPVTLYVFFVGCVTILLIARAMVGSSVSQRRNGGLTKRSFRFSVLSLAIGATLYMTSFVIAFVITGSTGARVVAGYMLWFVSAGFVLAFASKGWSIVRKARR